MLRDYSRAGGRRWPWSLACSPLPSSSPPRAKVTGSVPASGDGWEGVIVTPPITKPKATLTDTSGQPFDFQKETQGTVTLLYVGYTHCPDICPQHMADIADVLKTLPADVSSEIKVVFVTADPDRDTADVLRKWLDLFNKSYIGLRGTQAQVDDFQRQIGISPGTKEDLGSGNYSVSHAAFVIAYGADNAANLLYPAGVTKDTWIHDLTKLVREGWKES
jgi:protein SCO1/2